MSTMTKSSAQLLRECVRQIASASKTRDGLSVPVIQDMVHHALLPALHNLLAASTSSPATGSQASQNMLMWLRHLYVLMLHACHPTSEDEWHTMQALTNKITQHCALSEAASRTLDAFVLHLIRHHVTRDAELIPSLVPMLQNSQSLLSDELFAILPCVVSARKKERRASAMTHTRAAAIRFVCEGLAQRGPLIALCTESIRSHLVFTSVEDGKRCGKGCDGGASSGEVGTENVTRSLPNGIYVDTEYADCAQVLGSLLIGACLSVPMWVTYDSVNDVLRCITASRDETHESNARHEDVLNANPSIARIAVPVQRFAKEADIAAALTLAIDLLFSVLAAPAHCASELHDGSRNHDEAASGNRNVVHKIALRGVLLALRMAGRTVDLVTALRQPGARSVLPPALTTCGPLANNAAWLQHAARVLTLPDTTHLHNSLCTTTTADDLLSDVCNAFCGNLLRSENDAMATAAMLATAQSALCESMSREFCVAGAAAALLAATDCLISAQHNYGVAVMRPLLARSPTTATTAARDARPSQTMMETVAQCAARRLTRWRCLLVMWGALQEMGVPYTVGDIASSYLTCVTHSLTTRRLKRAQLPEASVVPRDGSVVTRTLVTCFRIFLLVSYSLYVEKNTMTDASFTLADPHQGAAQDGAATARVSGEDYATQLQNGVQALQGLRTLVNGTPYQEWLYWAYLHTLRPLCAATRRQSEAYVTCLLRLLELAEVERGTTLAATKQLYYGLVDLVKAAHSTSRSHLSVVDEPATTALHQLDTLMAKLNSRLVGEGMAAGQATGAAAAVPFVFADATTTPRPPWPHSHALPQRGFLIDTDWLHTLSGLEHVPSLLQEATTRLVDDIVHKKVSLNASKHATARAQGSTLSVCPSRTLMSGAKSPLRSSDVAGRRAADASTPATATAAATAVVTTTATTAIPASAALHASSSSATAKLHVAAKDVMWWWEDVMSAKAHLRPDHETCSDTACSDTATSYTTADSIEAGATGSLLGRAVQPRDKGCGSVRLLCRRQNGDDGGDHARLHPGRPIAHTASSFTSSSSLSSTLSAASCTIGTPRRGVRPRRAVRRDRCNRRRCHCCHTRPTRVLREMSPTNTGGAAERAAEGAVQRREVPSLLRFTRVLQPPREVHGVARCRDTTPPAAKAAGAPPVPIPATPLAQAADMQTHPQSVGELTLLTLGHGTARVHGPVMHADRHTYDKDDRTTAPQENEDTLGLLLPHATRRYVKEMTAPTSSSALLRPVFAHVATQPRWCTAMSRLRPPPLPYSEVLQAPPPLLHLAGHDGTRAARVAQATATTTAMPTSNAPAASSATVFTVIAPHAAHPPAAVAPASHACAGGGEQTAAVPPADAAQTTLYAQVPRMPASQIVVGPSTSIHPPPTLTQEDAVVTVSPAAKTSSPAPPPPPPRILPVAPTKSAILSPSELTGFHLYTSVLKSRHELASSASVPGSGQEWRASVPATSGLAPSYVPLIPQLPDGPTHKRDNVYEHKNSNESPSLAVPIAFPQRPSLPVAAESAAPPSGTGVGSLPAPAFPREGATQVGQPAPLLALQQEQHSLGATQQAELVRDVVAQKNELLRLNRQLLELQLSAARGESATDQAQATSMAASGKTAYDGLAREPPVAQPSSATLPLQVRTSAQKSAHDVVHDTATVHANPPVAPSAPLDALATLHRLQSQLSSIDTPATAMERAVQETHEVIAQYGNAASGTEAMVRQGQAMLDGMRHRIATAERDLRDMQYHPDISAPNGAAAGTPLTSLFGAVQAGKSITTRIISSHTADILSEEEKEEEEEGMSTSSSESTVVQVVSLKGYALPLPQQQQQQAKQQQRQRVPKKQQQEPADVRRVSFHDGLYKTLDQVTAQAGSTAGLATAARAEVVGTARRAIVLNDLYRQAPSSVLTWGAAMKLSSGGRGRSASPRGDAGRSSTSRLRSVSVARSRSGSARRLSMYAPRPRRCGAGSAKTQATHLASTVTHAAPPRRDTTPPHQTLDDRFFARQSQRREAGITCRIARLEREFA